MQREVFIGDPLPCFKFSLSHLNQYALYIDYGDDEDPIEIIDYKVFQTEYTNGPDIRLINEFTSIATVPTSSSEEYIAMSTFTSDLAYLMSLNIIAEKPGTITITVIIKFKKCSLLLIKFLTVVFVR